MVVVSSSLRDSLNDELVLLRPHASNDTKSNQSMCEDNRSQQDRQDEENMERRRDGIRGRSQRKIYGRQNQ